MVGSTDPAFVRIDVVRTFGTEEPANVKLALADPASTSPAKLRAAFGDFRKLPQVHFNSPTQIQFAGLKPEAVQSSPGSVTCTILADIKSTEQSLEDSPIVAITVRRDKY